jgi:hypothetical protein
VLAREKEKTWTGASAEMACQPLIQVKLIKEKQRKKQRRPIMPQFKAFRAQLEAGRIDPYAR